MRLDKIWKLTNNSIISKIIGGILLFPAAVLDGFTVIFKIIKSILIKKWADEIHHQLLKKSKIKKSKPADSKNIAGLGGQDFYPAFISWNALYEQCHDPELKRWAHCTNVVREHLFFAYFGPLESWCDKNCQGPYYLWSDSRGIHRQFVDPIDAVLWTLTWSKPMPDLADIEKIYK